MFSDEYEKRDREREIEKESSILKACSQDIISILEQLKQETKTKKL